MTVLSGEAKESERIVDHDQVEHLRRHPGWSLLRANNAALVLSFLSAAYIERSAGNTAAAELSALLDDHLFALNQQLGEQRYPRSADDYLNEWSDADHGWLRRFYPPGSDEAHYDLTPAVEKAAAWVETLGERSFIGTESRLTMLMELLRQLVVESDDDPATRLADLQRRRDALDAEIERIQAGGVAVADPVTQRDRYQQFARTARELLSDFREVEENFRSLDRDLRRKIAGWTGSKGELLDDVVATRSGIAESDQGRSFRAFYELLLTAERQAELTELLDRLHRLEDLPDLDQRLARVHYDWIDASERTQATVRRLSEQLRRFLDDQVWLENRRVFDLLRSIEAGAVAIRDVADPPVTTTVDAVRPAVMLPMERPLYRRTRTEALGGGPTEGPDDEVLDTSSMFEQLHVDRQALVGAVHRVLGAGGSVSLDAVLDDSPLEHGLAELVAYFSLHETGLDLGFDDATRCEVHWTDEGDQVERVANVPQVSFSRSEPTS